MKDCSKTSIIYLIITSQCLNKNELSSRHKFKRFSVCHSRFLKSFSVLSCIIHILFIERNKLFSRVYVTCTKQQTNKNGEKI